MNKDKLIHSLKMTAIYLSILIAGATGILCAITVMFHLLNGLGLNLILSGLMIFCMIVIAGLMDLKRRIKDPD